MKISIALATYNGSNFLQEQLDSFSEQTRHPDELIVCDDCSTDITVKILETFKNSALFNVKIYRNEFNLGYKKNFEKCLSLSEGDVIMFSDQDDVWYPEKIKTIERFFVGNENTLLVINDQMITDENLFSSGMTKLGNIKSAGFSSEIFRTGCCTSIRSNLKSLLLPFPSQEKSHDTWIHSAAQAVESRIVLDKPLQYYRRHSEAASDWVFSRAEKPSRWNIIFLRKEKTNEILNSYISRVDIIQVILDRLEKIGKKFFLRYSVSKTYSEALLSLKCEQSAIVHRINALRSNGLKRKALLIRMLVYGEYKYFLGWKSFLKDIMR